MSCCTSPTHSPLGGSLSYAFKLAPAGLSSQMELAAEIPCQLPSFLPVSGPTPILVFWDPNPCPWRSLSVLLGGRGAATWRREEDKWKEPAHVSPAKKLTERLLPVQEEESCSQVSGRMMESRASHDLTPLLFSLSAGLPSQADLLHGHKRPPNSPGSYNLWLYFLLSSVKCILGKVF